MSARIYWSRLALLGVVLVGPFLSGCRQDMHDQPKYKPYRPAALFADGRSDRPRLADTVARGELREDVHLYEGRQGEGFAREFPFPVTEAVLRRGQERYNIYCTPCHDGVGTGQGMIVQRGYRQPPSFHIDRLRTEAPGYFYHVIANGFGVMPSYSHQVGVEDRWAIAAYIRALQLSQNAMLADVPAAERPKLDAPVAADATRGGHHE